MTRIFDIAFSLIFLGLLSPLLFLVIMFLSITGEKEVFYGQVRIGKGDKKFRLLKFATMLKNSPNIGTGNITIDNDPRILPFGKFLRTSKINELPQLWNIFKGDMSFIGPRPLTHDRFAAYSQHQQEIISKLRPGLSGIGSIIFRDEEKILNDAENANRIYDDIIAPYKGDLEIWYAEKNSVVFYFLLIFLTIFVVLKLPMTQRFLRLLALPDKPQKLKELMEN